MERVDVRGRLRRGGPVIETYFVFSESEENGSISVMFLNLAFFFFFLGGGILVPIFLSPQKFVVHGES